MVKISDEDKEFLKKHIDNVDELVQQESSVPLLDAIDDIIIYKGFEPDFDTLNKFGLKAQYIRDTIYYDNTTED